MEGIAREVKRVSLALFGSPDVLDEVDAILVIELLHFVNSRPALGKSDKVALAAIVQLSHHEGAIARGLLADLV